MLQNEKAYASLLNLYFPDGIYFEENLIHKSNYKDFVFEKSKETFKQCQQRGLKVMQDLYRTS